MMSDRDVDRLKGLSELKTGDPLPDWLQPNDWVTPLAALHLAAYREIEDLRAALMPFAKVGRPFINATASSAIPSDASARFLNLEPLVAGDLARAAKALTQQ